MVIIGNCGGSGYGTSDSGPHAVLTADDVDYTYDDVGNMVTATDASANTTTYGYDDLYHLTGVDFPAGDDLAMVYDANGTRVPRSEGDTTVTYVGGLFEVEDDGVTTTLRTHYTFGGDHIAVRVDDGTTDTLTYQFTDHLGSVATTYDAGTAGTTNRYLHYYYPYGEPRGTQTDFPSDHTYTGQIDDPGGLMYYQARYYQPAIGRFTQADTLVPNPGSSQDYNRYMYVRGSPIGFHDPSGRGPTGATALVRDGTRYVPPTPCADLGDPEERIGATSDFMNLTGASELAGQLEFQVWMTESGRLDPETGSAWWRAVNLSMIEDMRGAFYGLAAGVDSSTIEDPNVRAWMEFGEAVGAGADGYTRQRMYWRAHQMSLHAAIHEAEPLLGLEPVGERQFIESVVINVDSSALMNFPTNGTGAYFMGFYLNSYPDHYPASVEEADVIHVGLSPYTYIYAWPGLTGLDTTLNWENLHP